MKITYRPIQYDSLDECRLLAKWEGDPAIRHLSTVMQDEEQLRNPPTAEEIQLESKKEKPIKPTVDFMILRDDIPIGTCDITFNVPHALTKEGKVAWIGIIIGEASARGCGIGRKTLQYLEGLCRQHGATAIEIGAFEFNTPSLTLFRSLGYKEIGRQENFTYWNGQRWTNISMLKKLHVNPLDTA